MWVYSKWLTAKYFHSGAAMSDCLIRSVCKRVRTSSTVSSSMLMSSVASWCWAAMGYTSVARKQWHRLVMVLVFAEISIQGCHVLPP